MFFVFVFSSVKGSEIQINQNFSSVSLQDENIALITDKTLSFDDITQKPFNNVLGDFASFTSDQAAWISVNVNNVLNEDVSVSLRSSKYNRISVFNASGKLLSEGGLSFPIEKRNHRVSAISQLDFTIYGNSCEKLFIKLELKNHNPIEYEPFPLTILRTKELNKQLETKNNYLFFFLGGIVLMIIYNSILYFQVHRSHYLYFVVLNVMILLFVLVQTGRVEQWFFTNYNYHERFIMIVGNLNLVAYIFFTDKLLNFQQHHPRAAQLNKIFVPVLIALNIPIAFGLFLPVFFGIGSVITLPVYGYVMYAAFKAVKRGDSTVSFFFFGNLFFFLGIIISVLMINGFLPRSFGYLTAIEVVEIGNIIQLSLFSLSMGSIIKVIEEKLRTVKSEKDLAFQTAHFKDQFLANMSHEIRTPLNGIIGMLDVFFLSHELDDKMKEQLGVVKNSSHTLLTIINDVLDLSKLQAGKMVISSQNVAIKRLVNSAQKLFEPLANEKNLDVLVFIEDHVPAFVKIDEVRVQQVINNLLSNAIKFTDSGSITLNVSIKSDQLLFRITDTGIGIPLSDQDKIFENFEQVNSSMNSGKNGTGLGLAISSKLIQLMGGEIGVESEPGKGSCFWFTIDFVVGKKDENTVNERDEKGIENGLNILLAEDKPINQKVMQLMLNKLGCSCDIAQDGNELIALYPRKKFDLLLVDVNMPGLGGIEALQLLKEQHTNIPPVIGLSASAMEGDAEKFIQLGFDDYLSKPVTFDELKAKLNKFGTLSRNYSKFLLN